MDLPLSLPPLSVRQVPHPREFGAPGDDGAVPGALPPGGAGESQPSPGWSICGEGQGFGGTDDDSALFLYICLNKKCPNIQGQKTSR